MTRLPRLSGKELINILSKLDFKVVRHKKEVMFFLNMVMEEQL